jgi:hypothetical protein
MAVVDVIINSVHSVYSDTARINMTININTVYDGDFLIISSRYLGPGSFGTGWEYFWKPDLPGGVKLPSNAYQWDSVSSDGTLSITIDVRVKAVGGFPASEDIQIIFQVGASGNPQFEGITPVFQKGVGFEPQVNTGGKGWTTLEQYYLDDNTSTGTSKANSSNDPNYVPPVNDSTACPIGQP